MWLKEAAELAIFISCLVNVRASSPTTLAPGAAYAEYTVPGPNRVFVVSVERGRREYSLAIGWPDMTRNFSKRQTTSRIASLYDQPPHHDVVAAVNASFFGVPPVVIGATASYGELQEMPGGTRDTLLVTTDGTPHILEDVQHLPGALTFTDETCIPIAAYNSKFTTGRLTAYTDGWGRFSAPQDDLSAVVIGDVARPSAANRPVCGVVESILRDDAAGRGLDIQPGQVLLVADCETGEFLRNRARVGERVTLTLGVQERLFADVDMAVTGVGYVVRNGKPYRSNWKQYEFSTVRHPRTLVAWNDAQLFLVVIDGRSIESVGMDFGEMASFLITVLQASEAVNLDGGGSSAVVVDGRVMNTPSDGGERAVANAVLLVREALPSGGCAP